MNQHINPTAREDVLPINEDLEIRYSLFRDGATYVRPQGSWRLWTPQIFAPPETNRNVSTMVRQPVREFKLALLARGLVG